MSRMTVVGNLTRDPELSFTNSGTALCKATVADSWRANKDAEEETSFIDVTLWGTLAENAAQSLKKGQRVTAEGRAEMQEWETENGEKRSRFVLIADSFGPDLRFQVAEVHHAPRHDATPEGPADDFPF